MEQPNYMYIYLDSAPKYKFRDLQEVFDELPKQDKMYFGFPIRPAQDEYHIWEWDYDTVDLLFQRLPYQPRYLNLFRNEDVTTITERLCNEAPILRTAVHPKALQHLVTRGKQMIVDKTDWQYWRMQMINMRANVNFGWISRHCKSYERHQFKVFKKKWKRIDPEGKSFFQICREIDELD